MIFGQTPVDLTTNWNQGVAVGMLTFCCGCFVWWLRRTYGKDGTDTKKVANDIDCLVRNTRTIEKQADILARMEDSDIRKQELCIRHAAAMEAVGQEMGRTDTKLEATLKASECVAKEWGDVNHREFRTPPVLDAMLHTIDTAEQLAAKCECDCGDELRSLRTKIADVRAQMQRE